MQIVIPMSGFGERFRRAGYDVPKPLIPVDGKPIIAHVVDLFPGETDIIFICNEDHLATPEFRMAEILRQICPTGRIVSIPAHKLGPVNAVLMARDAIDPAQPTIVNYCDFTCYWNYADFKRFVQETDSDGCVPAYRGFHPHSLGSTFYAYMKHSGLWMDDIQEKQPWTDDPTNEYASSGTYYFKTGQLCLDAFDEQVRQDLSINGEYYASLAYRILKQRGLRTSIFDLQHFMQWGTPADLEEYNNWSNIFRRLAVDDAVRARQNGTVLVPMAGLGKRYADAGYTKVKPLIPVSGRAMALQATRDLPEAPRTKFVLRRDMPGAEDISNKLMTSFVGAEIHSLDGVTEGQAITCQLGLDGVEADAPLTIGACDNGMLYDVSAFENLIEDGGPDVIVWVIRGHFDGKMRPQMFGWVEADTEGRISGVRVKQAPDDPATAPMIVGAFTFRTTRLFEQSLESLIARDGRVNNEYYVDSLIEDAVKAGLDCRIFEIDHYIGWGTPNDLKTFEYWQSCFHKWPSHPYKLGSDRRIPRAQIPALAERYAARRADRPDGIASAARDEAPSAARRLLNWLGDELPLIPIGLAAVLLDFLVYMAVYTAASNITLAKTLGYVAGGILAFGIHRYSRLGRDVWRQRAGVIAMIYGSTLVLNVVVNAAVFTALGPRPFAVQLAFLVATATSTVANYLGLKIAAPDRSQTA